MDDLQSGVDMGAMIRFTALLTESVHWQDVVTPACPTAVGIYHVC